MRHRVDTFKIGRSGAHRRAMLANMVSSLFEHGRMSSMLYILMIQMKAKGGHHGTIQNPTSG